MPIVRPSIMAAHTSPEVRITKSRDGLQETTKKAESLLKHVTVAIPVLEALEGAKGLELPVHHDANARAQRLAFGHATLSARSYL